MLVDLLDAIAAFATETIGAFGVLGIFFLMVLTSANVPVPSEIIMTFSGFLAATGAFSFWAVVAAGVAGDVVGSLISYHVATRLDGKLARLKTRKEFQSAERWYKKFGVWSVFLGRLLPVVRTFISFPAGLFKVDIWKFVSLTALGSFIWCAVFTKIGFALGENWESIKPYLREFDFVVIGLIVVAFILFIWHHFKKR